MKYRKLATAMKNIISKFLTLFLIPLILGGGFYIWSLPRIRSDYNFNTDELIYLERSKYWEAFKSGDFANPIWQEWGGYDQPQLVNYVYGLVPGDRSIINSANSPCNTTTATFDSTWSCLAGKPISDWPSGTDKLQELVVSTRQYGLAISSLVISTTYYLGFLVGGPVVGILAALYLGFYSFFKNLATMAMMDQILLLLLNLQLLFTLYIWKIKKLSFPITILLTIVTGLAVSAKFSALPPTLILYLITTFLFLKSSKKEIIKLVISSLISVLIFISFNPYLWPSPVKNLQTMLTWRLSQARAQQVSDPAITPISLTSRLSYSYQELLGSWNHKTTFAPPLLIVGALGVINLFKKQKKLATYLFFSALAVVIYLPIFWNRYLLPAIVPIALVLGLGAIALPSYIRSSHKLIFPTLILTILTILTLIIGKLTIAETIIFSLSILLTAQGALVTIGMLYGLVSDKVDSDNETNRDASPRTFTLILPVKNESQVVKDTLSAINKLCYRESLYEVLIPVRADDHDTIKAVKHTIKELDKVNFKIIEIDGDAFNKPYSLNLALHYAKGEIVGVFDAEDEPHPELLNRITAKFSSSSGYTAVQAPVQLINLNSSWYSALNCLEYFFWFRSVLPFLSRFGVTPLGGNTVFIKTEVMKKLGGWDEKCLTEDAELGIRLSSHGYKIGLITDPTIATREETPGDELGIVKQRSRWDQGYLQIIQKKSWVSLSSLQKALTVYVLSQPLFRHLAFINMLLSPILAYLLKINLAIALFSFIPSYFLFLQWGMYLLGLRQLANDYQLKVPLIRYLLILLYFYPYQALLSLGTGRALVKYISGNQAWDKTEHMNAHRKYT